ncbi:MAG: DUF4430 domain-containing protein [Candidatus Zixiibacteriota bacterium]
MLRFVIRYLMIACAVLTLFVCGGCGKENEADSADKNNPAPVDSLVIVLNGESGKSVFELTQREHAVDYISSIEGNFVQGIDSIAISSKYGWMYSVNDTMGRVASDKHITNDGDIIKWHYRKF